MLSTSTSFTSKSSVGLANAKGHPPSNLPSETSTCPSGCIFLPGSVLGSPSLLGEEVDEVVSPFLSFGLSGGSGYISGLKLAFLAFLGPQTLYADAQHPPEPQAGVLSPLTEHHENHGDKETMESEPGFVD